MRICVDCPARFTPPRPDVYRCPACEPEHQRRRNARRTQYQGTWRATSRRARRAQPWCSVCGTSAYLTLDHETGEVQCRVCNSRHRRNPA